MSFVLIALLMQAPAISPNFFIDGERIILRSTRLSVSFRGFSRADMIEIVPAGRQEEPSVRITSAAIRNLILLNREKSYEVAHDTRSRQTDSLNFTPADLRQDSVLIVSVPEGLRLSITYNGIGVPVTGPFKETIFLNDLEVRRGAQGAVIEALNRRLKNAEIVLPVVPPVNPKARAIHSERPDLTRDEIRILGRLSGDKELAIRFEATVTDTGQVIDVRALAGIPARTPRGILDKLQDAAMRYSFEPYVLNGKAATFTTTIVLEMP